MDDRELAERLTKIQQTLDYLANIQTQLLEIDGLEISEEGEIKEQTQERIIKKEEEE